MPMRAGVIVALLFLFLSSQPGLAGTLHEAATAGRLDAVKVLLDQGADTEALGRNGETPLISAALAGHAGIAALLIDRGAAVGARNKNGYTALHAAAYSGHLDLVKLLVDRGADVNDQNNKAKASALHLAAEENQLGAARSLIEQGAAVEAEEVNKHTPTTKAIFRLHGDMVELLRGRGATCQPVDFLTQKYYDFCREHGG